MLRNYLLVALRLIRRQRGYSVINILGLAVGLACCLLIALFVRDELAYDRFHEHANRIYRVVLEGSTPNTPPDNFAVTGRPVGPALLATYPEVEAAVRIAPYNPSVRQRGEYFFDDDVFYAEPSFFEVFTFPLVEGDAATALRDPYTAVVTESTALRYFPGRSAVGETLVLDDSIHVAVTGIARDAPAASHFSFDILLSFATYDALTPEPPQPQWLVFGMYTYVLLRPGVDAGAFTARIENHVQEAVAEVLAQISLTLRLGLEPLTGIYLHSQHSYQIGPTSSAATVYAFLAIALFVLLIACVNYMNLATARSMQRAREVGVRKSVGASRGLLVRQFLGESVLMAMLALVVALVLVALALPFFNAVAGKELSFWTILSPEFLLALVAAALAVGLLAGSYPALVLSGFVPALVLKGELTTSRHGARLRQGLVVFQFAVSVALIVGTVAVIQQLNYVRAQDLGFDREHLVVLTAQGVPGVQMAQRYETAKERILQHPGVLSAAASSSSPGNQPVPRWLHAEGLEEDDSRRVRLLSIDHDFVETYGLDVIAGRPFSRDFETDPQAALINESAVAAFGWGSPEEALGKWVDFGGSMGLQRPVVGVVRDYHHLSLHERVEPMAIVITPSSFNRFTLRLDGRQLPAAIEHMQATWAEIFPGFPFEYAFVDETFDTQYQAEARLSRVIGAFAALAILVACLGLFGLAAFTAQQRRREIGVRKVLGASTGHLVTLLSKDFLVLVAVAFVIGAPLAYFGMNRWLEGFAYRVTLGPELFLAAGLIALIIAGITVSGQALRAAMADPVKAIRAE
jgi:putative ABC transport system permease protein